MKLLVTGSSGAVGRHFRSLFGGLALEDEAGLVDLRDASRVRSVMAAIQPEAVLHLAAQSSVADSFDHPRTTYDVNFFGTLNLLEALGECGFSGPFLYVGSADVYGSTDDSRLPISETHPLHPRSPYGVSKVAAEALCYQWSQTQNFRIVLTRPFNLIGPGQDARFAVPGFARQIVDIRNGTRDAVIATGDLDVTRDFTDIRDAVRAYRLLLDAGENGEIYNVCSGRERSLREIVLALLQLAGIEATLCVAPERLRPHEQRRVAGDPGKLFARTGWAPQIPFETTLKDILKEAEDKSER